MERQCSLPVCVYMDAHVLGTKPNELATYSVRVSTIPWVPRVGFAVKVGLTCYGWPGPILVTGQAYSRNINPTLVMGGSQPGIWLTGYQGEDQKKKGKMKWADGRCGRHRGGRSAVLR
jgi:hypothetical protein